MTTSTQEPLKPGHSRPLPSPPTSGSLRRELARRLGAKGSDREAREPVTSLIELLAARLSALETSGDPAEAEVADIYRYWFGPLAREWDPTHTLPTHLWFAGAPGTDEEIGRRFGALMTSAQRGALTGPAWTTTRGLIARLVLLDQFPRNVFRGTPRMFATDAMALSLARLLLQPEHHDALSAPERATIYLCLTHVEEEALVAEAVARFEALVRSPISRGNRKRYKRMLSSARKHLRALARFGRYPHRNELLGRTSTPAERGYLAVRQDRFIRSVRPHRPAQRRLKILVLHSFRQSGARLHEKTRALREQLGHLAEFIYLDAPHPYRATGRVAAQLTEDFGDDLPAMDHQRCWWNSGNDHRVYDGWETSLASLQQAAAALGPFDGVLGFSQGGAVAGLLAALQPEIQDALALRFAICVSGFPSRAEEHATLMTPGSIDLPSLHIYGERDVLVDNARSLALAGCFVAPAIASHPAGHFVPSRWPLDVIEAFLRPFAESPTEESEDDEDGPQPEPRTQPLPDDEARALAGLDITALRRVVATHGAATDALLETSYALHRPHDYAEVDDITDPLPGDGAHRLTLAVLLERDGDASARARSLARACGWKALTRLALLAHLELPAESGPIAEVIATCFAHQLAVDIEHGVEESACAIAAPRIRSATDRRCRIARRIAVALTPGVETMTAYARYRRLLAELSRRRVAAAASRRRVLSPARALAPWTPEALAAPISDQVRHPLHEPVVPCPTAELDPLLEHLERGQPTLAPRQFTRGTHMPDGRLDLCKQVVGPMGIAPLLSTLADNCHVRRLLLGNNIIGNAGAGKIAHFIQSGRSRVNVWYIPGNRIDADGLAPVCDALIGRAEVEGLWLKRNPIGPAGAEHVARVLRDPSGALVTLDLVNTGLLDEGLATIAAALHDNRALRHLYLGTDGITAAGIEPLARYLETSNRLESLYVDCNRLGDEGAARLARALKDDRRLIRLGLASNRIGPDGAAALAEALTDHPSLRMLDLGWTRATAAVGELGNRIGSRGCEALATLLRHNQTLQVLDISHNSIPQRGLDLIGSALEHNTTLVALRCPQWGKAVNHDSQDRLRARLESNRRALGVDPELIRTPRPTREIASVYRTAAG